MLLRLHEPAINSSHKCTHGISAAAAVDGARSMDVSTGEELTTGFQPVLGFESSRTSPASVSKEAEVRQLGDRAIGEGGEGAFSLRRILGERSSGRIRG